MLEVSPIGARCDMRGGARPLRSGRGQSSREEDEAVLLFENERSARHLVLRVAEASQKALSLIYHVGSASIQPRCYAYCSDNTRSLNCLFGVIHRVIRIEPICRPPCLCHSKVPSHRQLSRCQRTIDSAYCTHAWAKPWVASRSFNRT